MSDDTTSRLREVLWWFAYRVRVRVARFLLDSTGIGETVVREHSFRVVFERARASGADVYCVYHDSDLKHCPPGEHDD